MSYRHSFKRAPRGPRLNSRTLLNQRATRRANQYQRTHAQTHEQIIQDIVGSYRSMIESDTPLSKKQYEKIFEKYPKSTSIKNRVPWSSGMSWKLFFILLVGIIGSSVIAGVAAGTAQARMNTPYASSSTPTVASSFAQQAPVAMFSPAMPSRVPATAQQEHGRPMHAVAAMRAMRVNPSYVPSVQASTAGVPSYRVPNYGAAPAAAFAVEAVAANQPRRLTPSEIDNEVEGRLVDHFRDDLHGNQGEVAKVREAYRQQIMAREAPQQSAPFMGVMAAEAQGGMVGYDDMNSLLYNRKDLQNHLLYINNTRKELQIAEEGAVAVCRVDGLGENACQKQVAAIEPFTTWVFLKQLIPFGEAKLPQQKQIESLKRRLNDLQDHQLRGKLNKINQNKDRLDVEILGNIVNEIISENVIPNKNAFDAKVKEVIAKKEAELEAVKKALQANLQLPNLPLKYKNVEEAKLKAVEAVQAKNVPKRMEQLKAAAKANVLQQIKGRVDVGQIEEAGDLDAMIKHAVKIDDALKEKVAAEKRAVAAAAQAKAAANAKAKAKAEQEAANAKAQAEQKAAAQAKAEQEAAAQAQAIKISKLQETYNRTKAEYDQAQNEATQARAKATQARAEVNAALLKGNTIANREKQRNTQFDLQSKNRSAVDKEDIANKKEKSMREAYYAYHEADKDAAEQAERNAEAQRKANDAEAQRKDAEAQRKANAAEAQQKANAAEAQQKAAQAESDAAAERVRKASQGNPGSQENNTAAKAAKAAAKAAANLKERRELPSSGTNALYAAAPLAAVAAAYGVGQLFYGNDERVACEAEVRRIEESYNSMVEHRDELSGISDNMTDILNRINSSVDYNYCIRLKGVANEINNAALGIKSLLDRMIPSLDVAIEVPDRYIELHVRLNTIQTSIDQLCQTICIINRDIAIKYIVIERKVCIPPSSASSSPQGARPPPPQPLVPPPIKINTHVSQYPPLSPVASPPPSPVASPPSQSQSMPPMLRSLSPLISVSNSKGAVPPPPQANAAAPVQHEVPPPPPVNEYPWYRFGGSKKKHTRKHRVHKRRTSVSKFLRYG